MSHPVFPDHNYPVGGKDRWDKANYLGGSLRGNKILWFK